MKQVSPAMIESVQPVSTVLEPAFSFRGDQTYGTEMNTYCVDFGTTGNFLRCSCRWFRRNCTLCKSFFAVINSGYREFEDLGPLSTNHFLHTIDTYLFKSENDVTTLVRIILLFQCLIISCTFVKYKPQGHFLYVVMTTDGHIMCT